MVAKKNANSNVESKSTKSSKNESTVDYLEKLETRGGCLESGKLLDASMIEAAIKENGGPLNVMQQRHVIFTSFCTRLERVRDQAISPEGQKYKLSF